MKGAPSGFIPLWDGSAARYCLRAFDSTSFSRSAFEALGLDLPEPIARSVPARQAAFFHGRLAARGALELLGRGRMDVGVGAMREPVWPSGIVGSITHNRRYAAAIALPAADHGGIGIDIETIADAEACAALARVVVNARELALLQQLAGGAPLARLLTTVFSAKESFYKAAFARVGQPFGFDALELTRFDAVDEANDGGATLALTLRTRLAAGLPAGATCSAHSSMLDADTVRTSVSLAPAN